jgi:hypothetical protein
MKTRSLAAAMLLGLAALAARAADGENPYKDAKVGDYATYAVDTKFAGIAVPTTLTQTVTKKTDKTVTVKVTVTAESGGAQMELVSQEQTIDITKPFDPTKLGSLPQGVEAKVEKVKDGKENLKAAGKEHETTWTEYKLTGKAMGQAFTAEVKSWTAKDVPLGIVKMTLTSDVSGKKLDVTMELKESGTKK